MTTSDKDGEQQGEASSESSEASGIQAANPLPAAEILNKLPPELRSLIEQSGGQVTTEVLMSMAMYRGPWPPPSILAEYEEHFPGWGRRLLELTERQVDHRHQLERRQIDRAEQRMDNGQKFGFAVAVLSIMTAGCVLIVVPGMWPTALGAAVLAIAGVGGPAVERVLATKFHWPNSKHSDGLPDKDGSPKHQDTSQ